MNKPDLLEDVKHALDITWSDVDVQIEKMIERSTAYLDRLIGVPLDYEKEDVPKELLLARCRYVWNNSEHEFEANYERDLSRLMLDVAISKREGENTGDETVSGNI